MSSNTPGINEQPDRQQPPVENPYFANAQGAAAPDLDANAPFLRSSDVSRLNRKALVFLGLIVAVLALAAVWLFGSALNKRGESAQPVPTEQVVIPAAPKEDTAPPLPPPAVEEPVPLAESYDAGAPVLPPVPDSGFAAMGSMEPRGLSLLERRMSSGSGGPGSEEATAGYGAQESFGEPVLPPGMVSPSPAKPPEGQTSAQPLYRPDTLLLRGTYIRCVLETRIITDIPGFTSCVVSEPVYSVNGKRMLLPKGSKLSGSYDSDAIRGERAAVVWDRITTPNGLDVRMQSPGIDNLGSAGHPGHYSAHWGEKISSALLISMLSDAFKYAGAKHGPQQAEITGGAVVVSPYESNTARTMERLANMALDKSMSRPATVTINQGTVVNVYVSRDVDFSTVLR